MSRRWNLCDPQRTAELVQVIPECRDLPEPVISIGADHWGVIWTRGRRRVKVSRDRTGPVRVAMHEVGQPPLVRVVGDPGAYTPGQDAVNLVRLAVAWMLATEREAPG